MKKRILAAVLTAVMAMGALTGCGSTGSKDNYTIGIMQYAVHGSLDNCREGFLQGLAEEGIVEGENLTIEYVNAPETVPIQRLHRRENSIYRSMPRSCCVSPRS